MKRSCENGSRFSSTWAGPKNYDSSGMAIHFGVGKCVPKRNCHPHRTTQISYHTAPDIADDP